ncbi:Quinate dehydrogenase [Cladophialophora carrionii]|uniref:Quinate dehydrogenase n=1 Tax=Cladophialophora carrionii TaxID=86049 RepID=A0A1C1CWS9_9EURO|nr:Quinate dehydrogenase [Cladophialophora carrionii]
MPRSRVYMAGAPGGGTIAAPAHDFIAQCLGKSWTMSFLEAKSIDEVVDTFRAPEFAGGIVTMPWKKNIIPHLDYVDGIALTLGACNHVSVNDDGTLHGTNTDWIGVRDALLEAQTSSSIVAGRRGLIIGAGGAGRAAVYALTSLGCKDIYVVNRDAGEVDGLAQDVQNYETASRPNVTHIQTVHQAQGLFPPHYIVGTVPDFEPSIASEIEAQSVYVEFLSKERPDQSVMLDMCYHPLQTRNLRLAQQYGWPTVDGVQVVGHQLKAQWKPWTGRELEEEQEKAAWEILRRCALSDPTVTPQEAKL